ncbi:hypothetical protein B0H13DRAFT_2325970 [Mycena leptocephala]|nr:hypothetical protein B0H13DRAFT_2325970 [Mycena leptocephala]
MSLPDGLPADLQRQIEVSASVFAGATANCVLGLRSGIHIIRHVPRLASFDLCLGSVGIEVVAWQASTSVWVLGASRSSPGKLRPLFGFWGIEVVVCHAATSV